MRVMAEELRHGYQMLHLLLSKDWSHVSGGATGEQMVEEIAATRALTDKPFGVNLTFLPTVAAPDYPGYVRAIIEGGVPGEMGKGYGGDGDAEEADGKLNETKGVVQAGDGAIGKVGGEVAVDHARSLAELAIFGNRAGEGHHYRNENAHNHQHHEQFHEGHA